MDKKEILAEERKRGREAAALMAHPLWASLWSDHRAQVIAAWEKATDTAMRESLWGELALAIKLRRKIERYATTGEMADDMLAKMEQH